MDSKQTNQLLESPKEDDHNEPLQEDENDGLQIDTVSRLLRPISKGDILLDHESEVGNGVRSMLLYAEDTKVLLGCKDGHLRGFETIGLKK